jgi:hypothetical protein
MPVSRWSAVCKSVASKPESWKSDGQRLLVAALGLRGEDEAIASACGVAPRTIANWKVGRSAPPANARAILLTRYGIPVQAWPKLHVPRATADRCRACPKGFERGIVVAPHSFNSRDT